MSYVEQEITDEIKVLPLDEQQQVLAFIRRLKTKPAKEAIGEGEKQTQTPKTFGEVIHKYSGRVDSSHNVFKVERY